MAETKGAGPKRKQSNPSVSKGQSAYIRYGAAIASVGLATLGRAALMPVLLDRLPFEANFVAITASAWYGGVGPGLLSAVLGFLAAEWFFVETAPAWPAITAPRLVSAGLYFLVASAIVVLCHVLHKARVNAALLQIAHDAILVTDQEGKISFWNRGAEDTYGWRSEEAVGRNVHTLLQTVFPIPLDEIMAAIRDCGHWAGEVTDTARDGRSVTASCRCSRLTDWPGQPEAILRINRDVTGLRESECREHARVLELEASERKFRTLYKNLPDGFVQIDMAGHLKEFNEAYRHMLGYSAEELLNLKCEGLTPVQWHSMEAEIIREQVLTRGHSEVYEKEYRRKDGTIIPVELRAALMRDESGQPNGMWAIVRDISERKRVEAAMRESERRERERAAELQVLMDAAPAIIWVAQDPQCHRMTGNRLAYDLLGLPPGANLSQTAPEVERLGYRLMKGGAEIPSDELPVQKAVTTGRPVLDCELELVARDSAPVTLLGHAVPLFEDGGATRGAVGVFIDITERKRIGEALRDSEERLRLAMEAASEAIWEYDPTSGIARVNDTGVRTYGRPPETESCSEWWNERTDPRDRERISKSFLAALKARQASWAVEHRFLRPDGTWADVHNRAVIAYSSSGSPTRIVGAVLDITDRKRAAEALRESNRRLHQLSRDLLRTQDYERRRIARELHDSTSQLLAALSMNLSRLREPALAADRRNQALSEAMHLAESCSTEIRTVTYLLHPPLLDQVGLGSALECYAQGFSQRTGIEVEVKISPDFGRLDNDLEAALFRIVQEGLANIHKHSGSQLAVIRLERDAWQVRLVLRDRGHGLPATLRQVNGFIGFGVGILGMNERAKQLGGTLDLASDDTGTTLTVSVRGTTGLTGRLSALGRPS